jgi:hypothetical protein
MVPRRGGFSQSRECSDAVTAAHHTCSAGASAGCASLLSAIPPVEVRRHAADLASEGAIGFTMLSSLHWSRKSLGGVIAGADACAMRSQHVDVSFNHLAGELPACLVDGTAASKTAFLGGNRFHTAGPYFVFYLNCSFTRAYLSYEVG